MLTLHFQGKLLRYSWITSCRLVVLDLHCGVTLVCVYAPNQAIKQCSFYGNLASHIAGASRLIAGDFNWMFWIQDVVHGCSRIQ